MFSFVSLLKDNSELSKNENLTISFLFISVFSYLLIICNSHSGISVPIPILPFVVIISLSPF